MNPIRLWIADDHRIVRTGLRQIVAQDRAVEVVGESADGPATLMAYVGKNFDLLLLDLSMPGGGIELLARLHQANPVLPILVLTMHASAQIAARAIKVGAGGYITKDADAADLLEAIRIVAAGGRYMDSRLAEAPLFERLGDDDLAPEILTAREREVLERLAAGQAVCEIAAFFGSSAKTVSVQKSSLMRKLKLANNVELFHYAMRHGLGRS